ncbi:hypothetical protein M0P98_02495 [bacterium]|nr:hypothetical protein [bacterium]
MKKFKYYLPVFFFLVILLLLPHTPRKIINIVTGLPAENVKLIYPFLTQVATPFFDFPFYFATLANPKTQIISWVVWLALIWTIYAFIKIRGTFFKRIYLFFRGMLVVLISLILIVAYTILYPSYQCKLKGSNPDEIFMDLHSHTLFSHDGLVTPEKSMRWHLDAGFKVWAITEHNWIGCSPRIQKRLLEEKYPNILVVSGEEVSYKKVHLNLLGIEEDFDTSSCESLKDIVNAVHSQKGAVIVPHYWAERKTSFTMEDLAEAGVDGFEITGVSSVPLTRETQEKIISFCKLKGLVMVSGTNWHGWKNFCSCWTVYNSPNWDKLDWTTRERMVINDLRNRNSDNFKVIGYSTFLPSTTSQIFEPFTGLFRYFSSLGLCQRFSWFFWIGTIYLIIIRTKKRRLLSVYLWFFITLALLLKSSSLFTMWGLVGPTNEILPEVARYLLVVSVITFLLGLSNIKLQGNRLPTDD